MAMRSRKWHPTSRVHMAVQSECRANECALRKSCTGNRCDDFAIRQLGATISAITATALERRRGRAGDRRDEVRALSGRQKERQCLSAARLDSQLGSREKERLDLLK